SFAGGSEGEWEVISVNRVTGETLPRVDRVARIVSPSSIKSSNRTVWILNGVISNVRYVERKEKIDLTAKQAGLGRPEATSAALIPIKKTPAWWEMPQDERRQIFEQRSHHTEEGLKYLPAVARQLYHCRDLGEPFDFLTWFEYAPEYSREF